MNSGIVLEFDGTHYAVVVLLGLGAILVLQLARMPLLKLYWQRATSVFQAVFVICPIWAHISSAKVSCVRMDSHRLAGSKMVLSRDHAVQKR